MYSIHDCIIIFFRILVSHTLYTHTHTEFVYTYICTEGVCVRARRIGKCHVSSDGGGDGGGQLREATLSRSRRRRQPPPTRTRLTADRTPPKTRYARTYAVAATAAVHYYNIILRCGRRDGDYFLRRIYLYLYVYTVYKVLYV